MSDIMLNQVSDQEIQNEYKKRFFLKAGDKLSGSQDAAKHLTVLLSNKTNIEQFAVIFLNAANCIITSKIMFKGSLTSSAVYPREIIKKALELDAASLIVGHNHPSGETNPSRDDIQITNKINDACKTV
ncbi:JAB domain-containing protein, partial [Candidatus Neomarinimicrobiota bacterium]